MTLVPEKIIKVQKDSKLEKLQMFLKMADIKILKNIPLHLEAMQKPIIKP